MAEVEIKIPRVKEDEVVQIPKGILGDIQGIGSKVDQLGTVLTTVVVAVVVSGIAVVIAVIGIFLDQMHFNSAAYKEYQASNQVLEDTKNVNYVMMQQISSTQQLIINQQLETINLLKKVKR